MANATHKLLSRANNIQTTILEDTVKLQWRRYDRTTSDEPSSETNAKQLTTKTIEHSSAGKSVFSRNNRLSCSVLSALYLTKTGVYIDNKDIISMGVSPSLVSVLELTKETNTPRVPPASSSFRQTLRCFRFSPGFLESCTISTLPRIPALAKLFRTSKQTPEAEPYTRSQSECPKSNGMRS